MPHAAYAVVVRGMAFFCTVKDHLVDLKPIRLSLEPIEGFRPSTENPYRAELKLAKLTSNMP